MVAFDSQQVEDQIVDLKCRTLNDFSPTKKYDTLTFLNCLTEVLKNSSDTDTMTEEIEKTRELWIDTFDSDEDGLEPRDGLGLFAPLTLISPLTICRTATPS